MAEFTVAFWNRWWQGNRPRQVDFLRATSWDVLCLAEVTQPAFDDFASGIPTTSSANALEMTEPPNMRHAHGVAVLTRGDWSIDGAQIIDLDDFDGEPRLRRERAMVARVSSGYAMATIAVWHAPNAADKDQGVERKRRGYASMNRWIRDQDGPLIVALDGNNWFEADAIPGSEETDPFWFEHRFHANPPSHGLIDTFPEALKSGSAGVQPAPGSLAPTYLGAGQPHRMDRIYASPEINVLSAGVHYEGRRLEDLTNKDVCAGSDHAFVWATVEVPG